MKFRLAALLAVSLASPAAAQSPDLATLARNTIATAVAPNYPLTVLTRPTPIQQKAFDLLGIKSSQ